MDKRWLMITADDLGMSRAINDAIRDGAYVGMVTAAGVLANGAALDSAREAVLDDVTLGVHLNLTEGRSLTSERHVQSLLRHDGSFFSLAGLLLRASLGLVRPDQVVCECAAQIKRLRDLGLSIRYADSHQHIHAHPRLAISVAQATREAGLKWVRPATDWSWGPNVMKAWAIAATMRTSGSHFSDFSRFDATRGIARRPTSLEQWDRVLTSLPRGRTELIVHLRRAGPVQAGEERLKDLEARQAEWRTLTDPRAQDMLARHGVQLVRPVQEPNVRAITDQETLEGRQDRGCWAK